MIRYQVLIVISTLLVASVSCNAAQPATPAQSAPAQTATIQSAPSPQLGSTAQPQKPSVSGGPFMHQIYSASSSDGLAWTLDNRLLLDHASVPAAIVTPEGRLRIYYVDATQLPENVNCAESSDGGITFQVLNCAIANRAGDKAVDPSIVRLPDGRYRLYYFAVIGKIDGDSPHSIYSAISQDGIHFTQEKEVFKYPGLVDPDVFWNGREWMMYVFSGKDARTIVARSGDGLSFEYVGPLGLRDWGTVAPIKLDDGRFRLYAFDQRTSQTVASFASSDGLTWTQELGVRMTAPAGQRITDPFVVRLPNGAWKMIFKVERADIVNPKSLAYEDSAFGIFGAFAVNEYAYFKNRMGFSNEQYWAWVENHIRNLGAHWTRSNLQLVWDTVEPTIGGYKWDNEVHTDSIIKRIYGPGTVHWLGVFHEGGGLKPPPGKPGLRNPLDHPKEYKAFVRAAVERYDGDGIADAAPGVRVKYWQAGNEVFAWRDSGRTVQGYIQFVRMLREATKQADAEAKLVLIAPTDGFRVDPFLTQVIDALAGERAFDVIDVHHWGAASKPLVGEPDWKMTAIPQYRQMLDAKGLTDVQIWSCENGTWQGQPTEARNAPAQSEQEQARSLVKRYVYNLNNGLDKLFWNNLMEWHQFAGRAGSIFNSMGLVTDGQGPGEDPARFNTERVAYWAYKLLAEKTDTHVAKPLGRVQEIFAEGRLYAYAYQRNDDGHKLYILWSETGNQEVTLSVSSSQVHATNMITDRFGHILQEQDISAQGDRVTLAVGTDPLLVEERKRSQ